MKKINRPKHGSAKAALAAHIRANGPIPTVRVSSAQAHGAAKKYPYWGAVRYEIRLTADGCPANIPLERASSDRRTMAGAQRDADAMAGRVREQRIGRLTEDECEVYLAECETYLAAAIHTRRKKRQAGRAMTGCTIQTRLYRARRAHMTRLGLVGLDNRTQIERGAPTVLRNKDESLTLRWLERPYHDGTGIIVPGLPWRWDQWMMPMAYIPYGDHRDAAAFAAEKNSTLRAMIWESCSVRIVGALKLPLCHQDDYEALYYCHDSSVLGKLIKSTPELVAD